jgi:hypothetical protein
MFSLSSKQERLIVLLFLFLFFLAAVIIVLNTTNSFGGGDHYSHYKIAHWSWKHTELLFNHWGKPIFTILISPFAVIGMDSARIFNVIAGILTAYFAWLLTKELKFKNTWLTPVLVVFTPIYFSLIFAVLTEVLHSLFLIISILLFYKKKYIWSAVFVSFLPLIRTESIILMPIFISAFLLKKQFRAVPFVFLGFLLISLLGFRLYDDFFWLVTKIPYKGNASSIYGHGEFLHFIKMSKNITGIFITALFTIGLVDYIWKWAKQDKFRISDNFYFLFLIPGIYIIFLLAHSFVW